MNFKIPYYIKLLGLVLVLLLVFILNIGLGSVSIPLEEIFRVISGSDATKESWEYIILNYRLPKAITAIIVGASLGLSGLLMQTLFRNPLAGPFVLGISSGASLGVALLIMGGSLLGGTLGSLVSSGSGVVIAACIGSFLVLMTILIVAARVRDTMALLIIGLMFGSITSAVVSILSFFTNSERLQQYIFWSFGSLGDLNWNQLLLLTVAFAIGIAISIPMIKKLDALLLGEAYAKSLGINLNKTKYLVILATSILAGSVTAFAGPIAFVGLAIPHLTKQFLSTTLHQKLLPAIILFGAILMLICDTISQVPNNEYTLPINAITSIIGAPVIIWLLVRKRKLIF